MISVIEGKIELKTLKFVIIKTNGVGYKVFCSLKTLSEISSSADKPVKLFTHSYIREDNFDLYGFLSFEELEFFEMLISVSGIGPKAALGVLSIASLTDVKASIASGQVSLLIRVSGIGKKTAERVILELRNKVEASIAGIKGLVTDQEAIEALVSLGYTASQARKALEQVSAKVKKIEERVKEALKILGK